VSTVEYIACFAVGVIRIHLGSLSALIAVSIFDISTIQWQHAVNATSIYLVKCLSYFAFPTVVSFVKSTAAVVWKISALARHHLEAWIAELALHLASCC